jgi:hypothetical protein
VPEEEWCGNNHITFFELKTVENLKENGKYGHEREKSIPAGTDRD